MNLNITGHHVDVTKALREYIESKIARLERHFDQLTDCHVILTVEKLEQKAEATLNLKGNRIFADAVDSDMYAAIDSLTDKLDRQLIKHKEKISDHHAKQARERLS